MNSIFRSASPRLYDYAALALVAAVFLSVMCLILLPKDHLNSSQGHALLQPQE